MSRHPFDPEPVAEEPPRPPAPRGRSATALTALWRGLVRYGLRPSARALVALGSPHVAGLWHPEFGPAAAPPEDGPFTYRTSRAGLQSGPEGWPHQPTPRGEPR